MHIRISKTRRVALAATLAWSTAAFRPAGAQTIFADECHPSTTGPIVVTAGAPDCQRIDSRFMGGTTAFGYYVPPACGPSTGNRCPVLYYLHGTGSSYRSGVGKVGSSGSSWIAALTSGPAVANPRAEPEPWLYSDTSAWVSKPPIDMIIIAPHGFTVPGGYGPDAGADTFWGDYNPRYAKGGDSQKYDTPAPEAHHFVVDELLPYVDARFPTIADRSGRALVGYSQGGFGAMAIGLRHPDLFSSIGAESGGTGPFPTFDGIPLGAPIAVAPPADVPYVRLPGALPLLARPEIYDVVFGEMLTVAWGDLVVDGVWWRGQLAGDYVSNATARGADGTQSLHIKFWANDAIPRRAEDLTNGDTSSIYYELLVSPTSRYLDLQFDEDGVEHTFQIGPGLHHDPYQSVYFREHLEQVYANVAHRDDATPKRPSPASFDYRTIERDFTIWGWTVHVERDPVEFLNLTDVTCDGLTVRGTGRVNVTPPAVCAHDAVMVDLGPAQPVDEPAGLGSTPIYGNTVHVDLR